MRVLIVLLGLFMGAHSASATAPDERYLPLDGRHLVAMNIGVLTEIRSGASVEVAENVSFASDDAGMLVSIRYAHWFQEGLALDVAVSLMDTDAVVAVDMEDVSTQAATVTRVLLGLRWQPPSVALAANARPYLVGSIGPIAGSAAGVRTGVAIVEAQSYSDTAMEARLGIGIDFLLRAWIAIGVEVGYALMDDFDRQIGGETNYSSPEFLVSVGASLGGGR